MRNLPLRYGISRFNTNLNLLILLISLFPLLGFLLHTSFLRTLLRLSIINHWSDVPHMNCLQNLHIFFHVLQRSNSLLQMRFKSCHSLLTTLSPLSFLLNLVDSVLLHSSLHC
jgi:hypothetical protein